MGILKRIKKIIYRKWVMRNANSYIKWMRSNGVQIGDNFKIAANGSLNNITIDMTRPSLVSIGCNVTINKNFTLVTHDFVSGIFLKSYDDFLPSSGKVRIGNNVRFGANCTVLKGVTIGDNCFISAGSVVSSDIPANSIAAGNPCKVVADLEQYYQYRKIACQKEAYLYAQSIIQRYRRKPVPADFWEEFPLFVNKTNINQYPEIPIKRQLGESYSKWLDNHNSLFESFENFLDYALNFDSESLNVSTDILSKCDVSEDILNRVRTIVSMCTESELTSDKDNFIMDEIEGWTSLTNMMIIKEIEQSFNVKIAPEEMMKMSSVLAISEIIQTKMQKVKHIENISNLYPHSLLLNAICENVERNPQKISIKLGTQNISYIELYENICKTASALYEMGLRHGDLIILSAKKDIFYIYVYFASHILGITNVIVDSESNSKRLHYIEEKIRPKLCFGYISDSYKSILYEDLCVDNKTMMSCSPESSIFSEQDIAEILFTTGTTGNPKGVCLTYSAIYNSATNINEFIKNDCDDIELIGLPLCHSFAMGRIRCNLIKGSTIVIINNFGNIKQLFEVIDSEKITGLGIVPAVWEYIHKLSGKSIGKYANQIKYIEIGSAAMSIESKKELLTILPNTRICMHYGLTEASRACFMEFHDIEHLNSIGKAVCDRVNVSIMNGQGEVVPAEEQGELCIKGNMVMLRYFDKNDCKDAFYGDYFRTGDIGYISNDGYVYLLGRKKEIINVGGKKVSPIEVEDAICTLGVKDCVCVPMKDPEGIMGELVKCYVLKGGTNLSFEEISNGLSSKLENYKRPSVYEWIDEIPYTSSGKKQRLIIK